MMNLVITLGNQLFPLDRLNQMMKSHQLNSKNTVFFMREDVELCTYFKFHKQKLVFFLSAMRKYKEELQKNKLDVHYEELDHKKINYEKSLLNFIKEKKVNRVYIYEIEDKFFEKRLIQVLGENKIDLVFWNSPMFLTHRLDFKSYLGKSKRPFMKVFYENQRKKFKILVDKELMPLGGQWSFDEENRKALPKDVIPPALPAVEKSTIVTNVIDLVSKRFIDHPGHAEDFWLEIDRDGALLWLQDFLNKRFENFGPYEDAIPKDSDFVFHSVLTPYLNCGLLTPQEVIQATLMHAQKKKIPLASTEGFIRQIIGWREFIRGIYQNFSEQQDERNFFNHKNKLSRHWYIGDTGVAPLDRSIQKVLRLGYSHHIERLMVIGSLMLLLEIDPREAHRWFMEMYIDSSDWVMGPNVYGMALFSDGGIFATKPYFCGSNYYRKMGGYKASEAWCDAVDGLYWGFIEKHKVFFLKNPRLSMMVRTVEKMDPLKKNKIYKAANELRQKLLVV